MSRRVHWLVRVIALLELKLRKSFQEKILFQTFIYLFALCANIEINFSVLLYILRREIVAIASSCSMSLDREHFMENYGPLFSQLHVLCPTTSNFNKIS